MIGGSNKGNRFVDIECRVNKRWFSQTRNKGKFKWMQLQRESEIIAHNEVETPSMKVYDYNYYPFQINSSC